MSNTAQEIQDQLTPLTDLAESWLLGLEAEGASHATLTAYSAAVTGFTKWYASTGTAEPKLDKPTLDAYLADLRRRGNAAATRRLRFVALRQFARWLHEQGEAETDTLLGAKAPKLDKVREPHLAPDEMSALVRACQGKAYLDRRDEALVRLMTECGLRAGETLALTTEDVDVKAGRVWIARGKGAKSRVAPFGTDTKLALDRYLRLRKRHRLAHRPELWLPGGGKASFGYSGLEGALGRRAKLAGVREFHLHKLRHTGAVLWLRSGRSPMALRAVFGWSDMAMVLRYTESDAAEQAIEEYGRDDLPALGKF